MPKVSICVPAFNNVFFLKRLLDSIVDQEFTNFDVIISDDSTDDGISNLVKKYSDLLTIKYIYNSTPLGTPANWNNSIQYSDSEYVKIMHHDDYFTFSTSLGDFVSSLDSHPECNFAFSQSHYHLVEVDIHDTHSATDEQLKKLEKDPNILYFGNFIGPPSAVIHRRNSIIKYDTNLKWLVDVDYYLENFKSNNKFHFINKPLITVISGYKGNMTSNCYSNPIIDIFEHIYVFKKRKLFTSILFYKKNGINFFKSLFDKYEINSFANLKNILPNLNIPFYFRTLFLVFKMKKSIN